MGLRLPMKGGCACGAVRYQVSGQPLMATVCHCTVCQKRTGSAFAMNLLVLAQDFSLESGEPLVRQTITGSGAVNDQHFCPECLVRTHTRPRARDKLVYVRPGTLDDPRQVRPIAQIWTSSARQEAILPDIAAFERGMDDAASFIQAWRQAHPVDG